MTNYTSEELLRLGEETNEMDFAVVEKPEFLSCSWCHNNKGKTELQFSVIDDDFGQYVKSSMIKFCPFCGRSLELQKKRTQKE